MLAGLSCAAAIKRDRPRFAPTMRTTLLQLAVAATLASAQLQLSTLDDSYAGITYTGTWVHEAWPNRPLLYGGTQSYSIDRVLSTKITWQDIRLTLRSVQRMPASALPGQVCR